MGKKQGVRVSNSIIRQQRKQAQRKAFFKKHRNHLIAAAIAAAVALVVIVLAVDYFHVPNGALRMFMGKLYGAEENMVIRELNGHYYPFATMDAPEGYEKQPYSTPLSEDENEQHQYYVTANESRLVNNVYVSGVKQYSGAEMIEQLKSVAGNFYANVSEMRTVQLAGHDVNYIYAQTNPEQDVSANASAMLIMYVDTLENSSVLVSCTSNTMQPADLPTEEAMMAEAEPILAALKLPQGV